MNSMKQILACSLAILVVYFSFTSARPVADDYTEETELNDDDIEKILRIPLINAHVRSFARKRHAEIRLSTEIGRRMAELKRIKALNDLMAELDTGKVYTIQNYSAAERSGARPRRSRHQLQRVNQSKIFEVNPTIVSDREIASELLRSLSGQTVSGGVKMRIVTGAQTVRTPTADHYRNYVHSVKNAVAAAKTCRDMQEKITNINLRLRVRCQVSTNTRVPHRRSN